MNDPELLDLLVVGAGPTGIAIGAECRRTGLSVLLVDRGPLTAAIQAYPTFLEFFTTRDRLEIADVPFAIPEAKPTRRQALVYYRSVVERYAIPIALHEDVQRIERRGDEFAVHTERRIAAGADAAPRVRRRGRWRSPPGTSTAGSSSACRGRISPGCTTAMSSRIPTSIATW